MKKPDLTVYEGLPDGTLLRSSDLVSIFGLSRKSEVSRYVKLGIIPKPTTDKNTLNRRSKFNLHSRSTPTNTLFWKLGDLRAL